MTDALLRLDAYDIVLVGASADDRGAIPLGNGRLCASMWATRRGISGYLARSDALTELDRTVKLCGFEIDLGEEVLGDPALTQRLRLRDGVLEIRSPSGVEVDVFVDADHDVLHVVGRSRARLDVRAQLVVWRTQPSTAAGSSGLYDVVDRESWVPPAGFEELRESADELRGHVDGVSVVHLNGTTILPAVAELHGLADHVDSMPDLLGGRIFGAFLTSAGHIGVDGDSLRITEASAFHLRVSTRSSQHETLDEWLAGARHAAHVVGDASAALARTRRRWNIYWSRSWIDVSGDPRVEASMTDEVRAASAGRHVALEPPASPITRAYVLTKWMTACAADGPLPILYNGSLFTLMPGDGRHLSLANFAVAFTAPPAGAPTSEVNPDERSWTVEHLWQNLRLPYHSLLHRGEVAALRPMLDYYRRFWELNRIRAREHHGAEGQWSTEMTLTFGLQSPAVYGVDRDGLPDGYAVNRWGGAIDLSPGLELVDLMFDVFWFTGDVGFLTSEVLPYADDLVAFILSRYPMDEDGHLSIGPINTLETYWDTINPLPVVAGLQALHHDVASLEPDQLQGFENLRRFGRSVPPLPEMISDHGNVLAPAESYREERKNVESPELYAVFPFKVHADVPAEMMSATVDRCVAVAGIGQAAVLGEPVGTPSFSGWQYLGPVHALLGDAERAAGVLSGNATLTNPGYRFPAMWGPIYDAVPDVDHGANILTTLQLMVLQVSGHTIRVLPAWPPGWDVSFRLYADARTVVEVEVADGALQRLAVDPPARRRDVVLPPWADGTALG